MPRPAHAAILRFLLPLAVPTVPATAAPPTLDEKLRAFAMTHSGDPTRGRALFNDAQKLACARCHSLDDQHPTVGPTLTAIGDKFGRADQVDAILTPSASIAVGYATTIVTTRSGDQLEGIIKSAPDNGLVLVTADGQSHTLRAADIASQRTSDVSMMPPGLAATLTPQQFADLIEYLAALRAPDSVSLAAAGMPSTIPTLAKPIELDPLFASDVRFDKPVYFAPLPGVPGAFTLIEHHAGNIWTLRPTETGHPKKDLFLATGVHSPGTNGLLGMAFHPHFPDTRRYFLVKHLVDAGRIRTHLYEGRAAPDLTHDSGQPLRLLMSITQTTGNHYGGCIAFGPDNDLYVGMGDSGPQQDPQGHAQDLSLPMGKMLRIDVDHQSPGLEYAIPPDNPFVSRPNTRPEIYATGLREPWRFSFDPLTHECWVGDVGQDLYEEVDLLHKGDNYGWNVYEAFAPFSNRYRRAGDHYTPPVFAYPRKYGASVTGGHVYRADPHSSFYGVYLFADYQSNRLFGLSRDDRGHLKTVRQLLPPIPQHPVSFGLGENGELYLVGYEGTIYRLNFTNARFE